jgi:hypothetical protein
MKKSAKIATGIAGLIGAAWLLKKMQDEEYDKENYGNDFVPDEIKFGLLIFVFLLGYFAVTVFAYSWLKSDISELRRTFLFFDLFYLAFGTTLMFVVTNKLSDDKLIATSKKIALTNKKIPLNIFKSPRINSMLLIFVLYIIFPICISIDVWHVSTTKVVFISEKFFSYNYVAFEDSFVRAEAIIFSVISFVYCLILEVRMSELQFDSNIDKI